MPFFLSVNIFLPDLEVVDVLSQDVLVDGARRVAPRVRQVLLRGQAGLHQVLLTVLDVAGLRGARLRGAAARRRLCPREAAVQDAGDVPVCGVR